jgi:cytochrome P450
VTHDVATEQAVYGDAALQEVAGWEDVRFVLRSRDFEQVGPDDGYPRVGLQQQIIGDSVVMARGEDHAERRHLESVLFRRPTLLAYETELVRPRLRRTLARLAASPDADGVARGDLIRISLDMLLELTLRLTGIVLESPEREERFRELFARLDAGSRVRHAADAERALREGLEAQRSFEREFFQPTWERHDRLLADVAAGRRAESEMPNDLITLMLRSPEHFSRWDEGVYLREATLFVIASAGTTTRELGLAVDAIERWIEERPGDADRRTDGEFLERAFAESLRLHQSIPSVGRVALADAVLPSGLRVERGRTVRVNLLAANRELLGPDADRFDPYREPPPRGDATGFAFSDGRHVCIGKLLVLGDRQTEGGARDGTAKTALLELYRAGMRRDPDREPVLKETITRRFETYPVVFGS